MNTNIFETKLSNRMQITRYSVPVFSAIVSFEEKGNLVNGQAVTRPKFPTLYDGDITRGADMEEQNYTEVAETLTVNIIRGLMVRVDDFDAAQHKTPIQARIAKDGVRAISKSIDALVQADVVNATHYLDAGDIGGTAGEAIVLDESNVGDVIAAAQRKLQEANVNIIGEMDPRPDAGNMKPNGGAGFGCIPPRFNEYLSKFLAGRETANGDQVGKNGYQKTYYGFDHYVTTNGYWVGVLDLATNPTDGDTVVINGVTLTAKSTLGATAGNFKIASTVDLTRAALAAALATPGTSVAEATDAGFVSLSAADQKKLRLMTFTNSNSADTLTVAAKGYGHVKVSETLTAAADGWTSQVAHVLYGQKGCIEMVMQKEIGVQVDGVEKGLGKWVKPHCLLGIQSFTEGRDAMVDVRIDTSSWS